LTLDAGTIVGLLADNDRRRCFAALELGASTPDAVADTTGLSVPRVTKALGRLISGGLVAAAGEDGLVVIAEAFQAAAREALTRPDTGEHDDQPDDSRKVLKVFVTDGRITQIPTARGKRQVLLDWLAQEFEPGRRYSEQMVNLMLGQHHADTASLRRYMIDEGILEREAGQYWRSGGTVRP